MPSPGAPTAARCSAAATAILHGIKAPLEDLKVEPKIDSPDGKAPEQKMEAPPTLKEQEALLLADARSLIDKLAKKGTLSQADADALRALATRVEKTKVERGAAGGPKQFSAFARPGQGFTFTLAFAGRTPACVRVFGNGVPVEVTVPIRACGRDAPGRRSTRPPHVHHPRGQRGESGHELPAGD
jgi:hypothetical protein